MAKAAKTAKTVAAAIPAADAAPVLFPCALSTTGADEALAADPVPADSVQASASDQGESIESLIGATVLMRSSLWMNGKRIVAGILTGIEETNFGLGDAQAIVSVAAFPPGSPSRTMGDVPLYAEDPGEGVIPAAWLRP